ncbi:hypothetical protein AMTRI_Chr09g31590 [Amborella trichopoda]
MLPGVGISFCWLLKLCLHYALKIQVHQFYMFLWFGNYMHWSWFSSKEKTFLKRSKPEILSKLYRKSMGNVLSPPYSRSACQTCCIESTIQCPYFGTFSAYK